MSGAATSAWAAEIKAVFGKTRMAARTMDLERSLAADRARHGMDIGSDDPAVQHRFEEARARRILAGTERATNTREGRDGRVPETHAVSGHGPETDQVGRLVHGRRADEMAADAAKPAQTALTGNTDLGPVGEPGYTTVGADPKNISGAFKTGRGMLNTVKEAFAQADMVSRRADALRRDKDEHGKVRKETTIDQRRLATRVGGLEEDLGYNLELTGFSEQTEGLGLSRDEMQKRYEAIEKTGEGEVNSAQVILDPAYVTRRETIKETQPDGTSVDKVVERRVRAGWDLQTAYPTAGEAGPGFGTAPQSAGVAGSQLERDADLAAANEKVAELKKRVAAAAKTVADLGKRKGDLTAALTELGYDPAAPLPDIEGDMKTARAELAAAKKPPGDPVKAETAEEKTKKLGALKGLLAKGLPLADLDAAVAAAEKDGLDAQNGLPAAEDAAKAAKVAAASGKPAQPADGEGARAASVKAGYDAGLNKFVGDRPEKPAELKGVDEDDDPLTAHHIRPWNQIVELVNAGLADPSGGKLRTLFTECRVTVDGKFWEELKLPAADRSYAFAETLNKAATQICWAPQNIFMGPLNTKRGDDPGEAVDAAYTRSGLPTARSAMAELNDPRRVRTRAVAMEAVATALAGWTAADATRVWREADENGRKKLIEDAKAEAARLLATLGPKLETELAAMLGLEDDPAKGAKKGKTAVEKIKPAELKSFEQDVLAAISRALQGAAAGHDPARGGNLAGLVEDRVIGDGAVPGAEDDVGAARDYAEAEWTTNKSGKRVRKGKVLSGMREQSDLLIAQAEPELEALQELIAQAAGNEHLPAATLDEACDRAEDLVERLASLSATSAKTIDRVLEDRDLHEVVAIKPKLERSVARLRDMADERR